ncbi:MAG: thiamine pyrophosphate-dependent dehydrogenase E1 component subunit alpha [Candidatus Microbacterium phytovorans]|uniref:2-oxoisovalerate dehydrogenase subunit alpha n=1 Tax=Candidatus Microbacterium phytovorans TaxID=3121374 RepID=A0AAJ5W3U8_9MICO|nr:thiamine pyrophosphate-dependent dehydrogenase E1 component subunit alpha [Microbacterium sp.]WEK14251.1 MAG: thiamine pyrophosphate-dependent dehydrogenase E1 component subunit alpha [Microbacterium sp.]
MTYTPTTDTAQHTDLDAPLQLLTPEGERRHDARLEPWIADLDAEALQGLYRDMAIARRVDAEGVALQRQGQLGLWAPAQGQEAIQIASARACRPDDFLFPSYRELGVLLVRGAAPADLVLSWRGEVLSTYDPHELHAAPPQIIIGAQALHAVGYAMGVQRDGGDQVAVAYFGDGATSQGDVNEAMVFGSSFGAPVVFVCSNNQWAISEPVTVQSKFPIAGRAPGFGIPSLRVDGNDVLACTAAMRWALDHARRGEGPAFLEAVTYRMGPHTTSDDPTRYRDSAELEKWRTRDPLLRLEAHLREIDAFDDAFRADVDADALSYTTQMRAAAVGATTRPPLALLDSVYAEPHTGIDEEREHFAAYLAGFADEETR